MLCFVRPVNEHYHAAQHTLILGGVVGLKFLHGGETGSEGRQPAWLHASWGRAEGTASGTAVAADLEMALLCA